MNATTSAAVAAVNASPAPSPTAAAVAAVTAQQAMAAYFERKFRLMQLFLLLGYGIMFLLCVILIVYMRYNRSIARKGNATAARKILLPAFEPLLWILGGATGTYTAFFCTALALDTYTTEISRLATEFFYSGRQFVLVSVVVFMLQQSVSIPALRRAVFVSFLLSTYTIPVVWYMTMYGRASDFYLVLMGARGLLLLLYVYVFVRPPARASKRTLREYCLFAFVYFALLFVYTEMFREARPDPGFTLAYANLLWGSLSPLVIWRVLKADTEHWRGMGQRAVALQSLFRQRGSVDERVSSEGLHVLIEMHRRYIIDFAYLEIQQQVGVGASAVVFSGMLHSRTLVAIKVYTPTEFNEKTVAEFSHEAALCGALNHPNIVRFYGMCVSPPTICLVSELCHGSLEDVMSAIHRRELSPHREQFLLNLSYMLDAARAVAYLHSFSPAFVHRDIKPANFLVDAQSTVKLTDFGESRSLPHTHPAPNLHPYMVVASGAQLDQRGRYAGHRRSTFSAAAPPRGSVSVTSSGPLMTVRGTVDYMAPEVINGRAGVAAYGEAADVYSLAITMWDILHPGREKFPTLKNNHLQIFEFVIDGHRPALGDDVHPSLRDVIQSAWQSDVRLRPSAQNIVHILEGIQEEVQATFALQLVAELSTERSNRRRASPAECAFSGADAITHMRDTGSVATTGEGVRLGNALLDAGLLHHLRHARSFEYSDELYYFDEDNIHLCRPISALSMLLDKRPKSLSNGSSESACSESIGGRPGAGSDADLDELECGGAAVHHARRSRVHTATSSADYNLTVERHGDRDGDRDRARSEQPLLQPHHTLCACRKLGQRAVSMQERRRRSKRFRRRKLAIAPILEELSNTGLTRSLLADDEQRGSEFDGFGHRVVGPVRAVGGSMAPSA